MYRAANKIIFSMEGGIDYINDQKWGKYVPKHKVYSINNGVDLKDFHKNLKENIFIDKDLENNAFFSVVYVGSIGSANNVKLIVDSANLLVRYNIQFLIFGDGPEKINLEKKAENNHLNVIFKGQVNKNFIPYILSKSNLNILTYKNSSTWKYGGSQNKLFEYMASGKPVISTIDMGYDLIKKYDFGISKEILSPEQLAENILYFYSLDKWKYTKYCENASKAAIDYDYTKLTKQLIEIIE
ncbi:MAG: glycosyltransferase, partial [Bacilli bacterium]|nr:glycosyltransferase [Bacilli bacterium]